MLIYKVFNSRVNIPTFTGLWVFVELTYYRDKTLYYVILMIESSVPTYYNTTLANEWALYFSLFVRSLAEQELGDAVENRRWHFIFY